MRFTAREKILFIGDSITDAGWRTDPAWPMGRGYVHAITNLIDACYADLELQYFNRGTSGNTVVDLDERWEADCLQLGCDWVSILVGINDVHRFVDKRGDISPAKYREVYGRLLRRLGEAGQAGVILWEPFYLVTPQARIPKVADLLGEYIAAVHSLAGEYSSRVEGVIRTQDLFVQACRRRWAEFWALDGVHPTPAGAHLMACEFLRFVGWKLE